MSAALACFRPMALEDTEWVAQCEAGSQRFPWSLGNFTDCLHSGYSCWVAELDLALAAFSVMLLVLDEAHLLNIGVAADQRRQGLGRAMLHYLYGLAKAQGATQFFLEVRPSNLPALALYESEGFATVGRRKGYYPAEGNAREDALVLRREL